MKNFKSWLDESAPGENDKSHYTHIEDELIINGAKAIPKIMASMVDLIKGLPSTDTQTKIDGSPSIFFGYKDGRFFVATKSIFNADPKINYTDADIDKNHGHAPGLVSKLKLGLKYLPSITGNKSEIMQGDVMFAPSDITVHDIAGEPHLVFQPNTVVNAIPVQSDMGRKIKAAKFGFAPHTKYTQNGKRVSLSAGDVKSSASVFCFPIDAPKLKNIAEFEADIKTLRKELEGVSRTGLKVMSDAEVEPLYMMFKNKTVREDTKPTVESFVQFIKDRFQKEIDKVKSADAKAKKQEVVDRILSKINSEKGVADVIRVHTEIERIKDKVIAALDSQQVIRRFFKGEGGALTSTNPEGYVGLNQHGTSKFVNRSVFSKQNFLAGQMRKGPVTEAQNGIAVIVPLARFNPPHKEHSNLIDATIKKAAQVKGTPIVFVSLTQNNKKDPLTADEKIVFLNKMYPGHAGLFAKPPRENPSIFGVLKELNGKYKDIVVVLGDDRVVDVKRMIEKYNGVEYHFDSIKVMSRHDITNTRSGDSDGVHASDIRRWCKEDDFEHVRDAMSPKLSDADVRNLMQKVKSRLA